MSLKKWEKKLQGILLLLENKRRSKVMIKNISKLIFRLAELCLVIAGLYLLLRR